MSVFCVYKKKLVPASHFGCQTVKSRISLVSLVARHGRVLERSRFRSPAGSECAREHASQQLGLADPAPEDEFHENVEYEEVPDFPEMCADLLSADAWHLVDYGRFVREEDNACERHRNVRIPPCSTIWHWFCC